MFISHFLFMRFCNSNVMDFTEWVIAQAFEVVDIAATLIKAQNTYLSDIDFIQLGLQKELVAHLRQGTRCPQETYQHVGNRRFICLYSCFLVYYWLFFVLGQMSKKGMRLLSLVNWSDVVWVDESMNSHPAGICWDTGWLVEPVCGTSCGSR